MEKSDSRKCLLQNDHNDISTQENEGFSSGYDSPIEPASDDETNNENNGDQTTPPGNDSEEVMHFRSTSALCEQMRYIMSMPELCDVAFLVGPNKVPIYGVKAVIGTRSRVFYHLILDSQQEAADNCKQPSYNSRLLIEVKMYEPEDFRRIVEYIHCGTTDVNVRNVTGLLCGAYQFKLNDLKRACWDFIRRCMMSDVDSVLNILQNAQRYKNHSTGEMLISKIRKQLDRKMNCQNQTQPEVDRKTKGEGRVTFEKTGSRSTTV